LRIHVGFPLLRFELLLELIHRLLLAAFKR
jgi:hypothetical protein